MTRVVTVLVLALGVALSGLVVSTPASAAPTAIPYTLTASDPTLTTQLGPDGNPCAAGSGSGAFPYQVVRFTVSASGSYVVADAGPQDGRVGVYAGSFSPASPLTGCLASVDVDETVALSAGTTYTLVLSTSTSLLVGSYSVSFDGPGAPTVLSATTTTLTSDPSTSELSKPTKLRAVVAGGATPTGSVEFRDGATLVGSAALAGGVAQLAVSTLALGNHTLTASYLGDSTHDVSTGTAAHKVQKGPKPKLKFNVSDRTPSVGQKIVLSWVAINADKVKSSGDWKGSRSKKGRKTVKIKKLGFHVFKLKAINVNGVDRAKVKVTAQRAPKNLTVTVPDDVLTANTKVLVRADGLDPKERFKVFLDDDLLGKGFADKRGDVRSLVRIPNDVQEGEHTLTVMGSNQSREGSIDVTVVTAKQLEVEVKKKKVKPNGTQTVTVSGLVEGEKVTVTYNGDELVEGVADAQGEFKHTFPVGDSIGTQTVEVTGATPARSGEATFEVAITVPGTRL